MDILIIALCCLPLVWMTLSPASFFEVALAWQYRDRRAPRSTTAVRATGIIGLATLGLILVVLVVQRVSDGRRIATCTEQVVPEVSRILEQQRADLDTALASFGASRGWTHTTIDGVSTTFRDDDETVLIVQHNPASTAPVSCW